jgi:hypothetical protein
MYIKSGFDGITTPIPWKPCFYNFSRPILYIIIEYMDLKIHAMDMDANHMI